MKRTIILCMLAMSASCLAATTNLVYYDTPVDKNFVREATDPTATLVLTKPLADIYLPAGSKIPIQFQTEDITNSVEVRLVKSLGNGAVDTNLQYVIGTTGDVKGFGRNKFISRTRVDTLAGDYGIFLFGTNAMTGELVHSVSSPTVHLSSGLFHPAANTVVRKGKPYTLRWKGPAPAGVDEYRILFLGNVFTNPIQLGTVSAKRNSIRLTIPQMSDVEGQFILMWGPVDVGVEIDGNSFRLK